MAPFVSPGKKDVIQMLKEHADGGDVFPVITLGKYQPQFLIRFHQKQYELMQLDLDGARAAADRELRSAAGYYMPEMTWAFLTPGILIIQESAIDAFIEKLDGWSGWDRLN
jgi:hypothetical protein